MSFVVLQEKINKVTELVRMSRRSDRKFGGDYWIGGYAGGRRWVYKYNGAEISEYNLFVCRFLCALI